MQQGVTKEDKDGGDGMPSELETRVMRRISFRIVPFIMLLYFIAFIDRVNIGFAALTMNKDLGFSPTVFGLGAGIFFVGYFLFEVPSNLILNKVGARLWIARVMITWGIISGALRVHPGRDQLPTSCGFYWASPRPASFPASFYISAFGFRRATAPAWFRCSWRRLPYRWFSAHRFRARLLEMDGLLGLAGLAVDVHYGGHPCIPSWLRRPEST